MESPLLEDASLNAKVDPVPKSSSTGKSAAKLNVEKEATNGCDLPSMDEEAVAAKKKKKAPYINTKLAHLTEAQRNLHKNQQKRQSRLRKEGKDPASAPRVYSSRHNLSGLTDQERRQRHSIQKAASKQRLKQEAMVSKEGEDVLSTPPALSKEALLNEYAASIRKVHQDRKAVEDAEEERQRDTRFSSRNGKGSGACEPNGDPIL
jgi:hypothetical protein